MKLKVKQIKLENNTSMSFIFGKPKGFNFYAGQYLDISLSGDSRTFTISSSPTENYLMITTKKGTSRFKNNLFNLKLGAIIEASHPIGTFVLDESSSAFLLAGGIGITPFRSMIKYALDQKLKTPITLIYSNSDDNFLFKEELDDWKSKIKNLDIKYINSSAKGRMNKNALGPLSLNSIFYLAGPPSFVDDVAKILLKSAVEETNIRYDRFDGY